MNISRSVTLSIGKTPNESLFWYLSIFECFFEIEELIEDPRFPYDIWLDVLHTCIFKLRHSLLIQLGGSNIKGILMARF